MVSLSSKVNGYDGYKSSPESAAQIIHDHFCIIFFLFGRANTQNKQIDYQ